MTEPLRFRAHTDGRVVVHDEVPRDALHRLCPDDLAEVLWRRYGQRPWRLCWPSVADDLDGRLTEAEVHGAGWSEPVLVVLPDPVVTARVCGCGVPPEGAPYVAGCSAECMTPALIGFDSDRVTVDPQDRAIHDGSGESYTADGARRLAAALLAGARYLDTTELTEVRRG